MQPAKICKSIIFDCGCMTTYHIKGDLAAIKGWAVIPCRQHSTEAGRETVKQASKKLDREFNRALPAEEPVSPLNAIPGRWYESENYGRVLCCGSGGPDWIPAFAVRTDRHRTELRFLEGEPLKEAKQQSR